MYLWRNTEARSCNRCSSGKAMNITQTVYVFVALGIQQAMRMLHIVICALPAPLYNIFPHYLITGTVFEKYHCI
jgi:hypothetical protein